MKSKFDLSEFALMKHLMVLEEEHNGTLKQSKNTFSEQVMIDKNLQ